MFKKNKTSKLELKNRSVLFLVMDQICRTICLKELKRVNRFLLLQKIIKYDMLSSYNEAYCLSRVLYHCRGYISFYLNDDILYSLPVLCLRMYLYGHLIDA